MTKLPVIWEKFSTGFGFIPSIFVLSAAGMAFLLLYVDGRYADLISREIPWLFGGTPDAARGLLSTIAASVITVISIAFSITIIALQQASTQYSPRVLRTFTKKPGNQVVLGTYIATFVYSLLVLRSVRTADGGEAAFVPALSITGSLVLALICMALLVYFINEIAQSLQVDQITASVHKDLVGQIEHLFPEHIGIAVHNPTAEEIDEELKRSERSYYVKAQGAGFVRTIEAQELSELNDEGIRWVLTLPQVGSFVSEGEAIIEINGYKEDQKDRLDNLAKAIALDNQRSVNQDPLFAIKQLVDTAMRALSPGINDPSTAENCIFYLGDAIRRLADRKFPSNRRTFENSNIIFIFNTPSWEEFVDEAFSQIRRQAADKVHVTHTLIATLQAVATRLPVGDRGKAIQHQLAEIRGTIESQPFSPSDRRILSALLDAAERALWQPPGRESA